MGDDLSYGLNTLGPLCLCLWQCLNKSLNFARIFANKKAPIIYPFSSKMSPYEELQAQKKIVWNAYLGLVHCGLGQKRRSTLGGVVEMLKTRIKKVEFW